MREPYVFPAKPTLYADYDSITTLVGALRDQDATPVAVGAGTLNDIVKRAAHELERPYLCVATAASMDGYTAFGAAGDQHRTRLPAAQDPLRTSATARTSAR